MYMLCRAPSEVKFSNPFEMLHLLLVFLHRDLVPDHPAEDLPCGDTTLTNPQADMLLLWLFTELLWYWGVLDLSAPEVFPVVDGKQFFG
jgi:hypothetical protein